MGDKLRVADVEHAPADELVPLITDRFDNLVTVAIAEATNRFVPQRTRRLLRKAEWRLDWQDALLCASGELQVATERMRYADDPRLEVTERRLRCVRRRRDEAALLVKKMHHNNTNNSPERKSGTSSHLTAQGWLRNAFPHEYTELLQQERLRRSLGNKTESPSFRDVHEQIAHAWLHGQLTAPRTREADALLGAGDAAIRLATADDAKDQEERNVALRHPLLLGRWENALRELGTTTAQQARAESPHALGTLPEDFYTLPQPEAITVLNARRFLAAVQQRRVEYKRCVRQITQVLRERKQQDPHVIARTEAKATASQLLIDKHPAEYAFIRAELRAHEISEGFLPTSLADSPRRAMIKRQVLTALAAGTWTR
ncbi:hypothetical protein IPZ58_30840 [Streptomyces roseoverticillatus]|uniref:hypothetical protein n=1 Tax=Streptomyces roseoverticillatus TaxID=66429 RepID=UPI001F348946|nr:hypothetical protein [Streptomyces roseoverticillatus]MCF3105941.1 hypothetical protein [Streptomyces roseoverticillatus]